MSHVGGVAPALYQHFIPRMHVEALLRRVRRKLNDNLLNTYLKLALNRVNKWSVATPPRVGLGLVYHACAWS